MERNAFLAGTPLFSGVASQEVGAMLDCLDAHERRYAQGERIHHMGDSVSTAGIVLTGRVRIEHVDPWGNVSVVGMRGPGAMFGEAYAAAGEPLLYIAAMFLGRFLLFDEFRLAKLLYGF